MFSKVAEFYAIEWRMVTPEGISTLSSWQGETDQNPTSAGLLAMGCRWNTRGNTCDFVVKSSGELLAARNFSIFESFDAAAMYFQKASNLISVPGSRFPVEKIYFWTCRSRRFEDVPKDVVDKRHTVYLINESARSQSRP